MGLKEELTYLISEEGIMHFKKGDVLKFDFEGSKTSIKITKVDRKHMRIWGEHITMIGMDEGMSHYGHNIDGSNPPFCIDCQKPVSSFATRAGDKKAWDRDADKMEHLTGKKRKENE